MGNSILTTPQASPTRAVVGAGAAVAPEHCLFVAVATALPLGVQTQLTGSSFYGNGADRLTARLFLYDERSLARRDFAMCAMIGAAVRTFAFYRRSQRNR